MYLISAKCAVSQLSFSLNLRKLAGNFGWRKDYVHMCISCNVYDLTIIIYVFECNACLPEPGVSGIVERERSI